MTSLNFGLKIWEFPGFKLQEKCKFQVVPKQDKKNYSYFFGKLVENEEKRIGNLHVFFTIPAEKDIFWGWG